jgi:hypothetical protein
MDAYIQLDVAYFSPSSLRSELVIIFRATSSPFK